MHIWLDKCPAHFMIYQSPKSFCIIVDSMNLLDRATYWYQQYKMVSGVQNWEQFQKVELLEFEVTTHRDNMFEIFMKEILEWLAQERWVNYVAKNLT